MAKWARIPLSLYVIFHIFCVAIAPNTEGFLRERVGRWVDPYLDRLAFSVPWRFFAPEPGPAPVFIEWETVGAGGDTLARGTFPEIKDPFFLRERQNRRIAM